INGDYSILSFQHQNHKRVNNMEKENLFKVLVNNEMATIYGGGYWVTERVDGILKTYWVVT
ncbi:hypothetical protein, partial [Bacteroides heparinolyticus]